MSDSKFEKKSRDATYLAYRHIKKIAVITGSFPPKKTMTYSLQEMLAFKEMGLDVTIFSLSTTEKRLSPYTALKFFNRV